MKASGGPWSSCDTANGFGQRLWSAGIAANLIAAGWVQTSDTGQATLASLPAFVVVGTAYGYQIFRMADALQSTAPVFLKIEYGCNIQYVPAVWISVGTGTNGAGTLTGQVSPRVVAYGSTYSGTASTQYCYFSGTTSSFQAHMFNGAPSNNSWIFNIERSKDAAGADNSEGVILQTISASVNHLQYFLPFTGNVYTLNQNIVILAPTGLSSLSVGNDITFLPAIPYNYDAVRNSGIDLLFYMSPDFPDNQLPTVVVNGVSHVYWTTGITLSGTSFKVAMRYE